MSLLHPQLPEWLHWLDSCPSTNTWALARLSVVEVAETGDVRNQGDLLNHGDVVFTPQQTAGRGQNGRNWHSPPGVLTASFVIDRIPAVKLPTFSLVAGLAVIYAIEELLPNWKEVLRLKWPNDVLLNGRKVAGILCEARANGTISRVVVGVGLNRCVDFDQAGLDVGAIGQAISLHQVSSTVPDELVLLERLRHYLLQTAGLLCLERNDCASPKLSALLPALRSRDALVGRAITLDVCGEKISGQAAGMSDRGHLLLRLENGKLRSFVSGHVLINALEEPAIGS